MPDTKSPVLKKYPPLIAAIAIQLTVGIAYIWSVFQTGVADGVFGGDNAAAGLTFSLVIATLGAGSVAGGKVAAKYSTRLAVFIGGVITGAGFFLASFTKPGFSWLLWVTYGVMGGVGMGFVYSTTIACVQRWYPHKKGMVTGIIVAAMGLGGVVFTPVVAGLISAFGGESVGELKTFMVLSAVFLVTCTVGSVFMKDPPEGYLAGAGAAASGNKTAGAARNYSTKEMLKSARFYLITATFMLGCMGGLMLITFAKPIAIAKGLESTATIGVLAVTMFNSLGRLCWGMVSDRLGRIKTIIILLVGTAALSLFVNGSAGYWIYVLIALIGFFYGGLLSNFPSLTAELFGPKNMAVNYGFVLLGFGAGGIISSQVAGYYKNMAAENIDLMAPAFVIASCCALAGVAMMVALKATLKPKG
jgi:OFA family oxalate/formate antiporter-like MFS transporter